MKKTLLSLTLICTGLLAADGAAIYQKCATCHGADGKKAALGKSVPIAGLDKAAMMMDMKAYQAGTLNKNGLGSIMKANMAGYSEADIEAVADYVSGL